MTPTTQPAGQQVSRYVGSADHLVGRAFCFTDPEGNGIELYQDRPRQHLDQRLRRPARGHPPNLAVTMGHSTCRAAPRG